MSRKYGKVISTANNDFTVELYQAVFTKTSGENLIFSPSSLHAILAMVGVGAGEPTRAEILRAIKFPEDYDNERIGKSYFSAITSLKAACNPNLFVLVTANRLYCKSGFKLNDEFVEQVRTNFHADVEQIKFSRPDRSAARMNEWVESATNGKIENVITKQSLNPKTCLVLVSGIYFKGLWQYQFYPSETIQAPFKIGVTHTGRRASIFRETDVDMMNVQGNFPYAHLKELDADAVELPYKGERLSMLVILPKKPDGLENLKNNLGEVMHGTKSSVWSRLNRTNTIDVHLPKFKFETRMEYLKDMLEALGMKTVFSVKNANLDGMVSQPKTPNLNLFISTVVQKAVIEVSEEGTEASAMTATEGCGMCLGRGGKTIEFIADHPFHFQIVDRKNCGLVLMAGHCLNPSM